MKNSLLPIILGAFSLETEPLRLALHGKSQVAIRETGVGSVIAAASTAQLLAEMTLTSNSPVVVFVGSAGSADKNIPIGTVVIGTGVRFADLALASGLGYLPAIANDFIPADEKLLSVAKLEFQSKAQFAPLYSPPSITADENTATCLSKHAQSKFENLELFGVATACARGQIPWISISCITNYLGPSAHEEWKAQRVSAAEKTCQFTLSYLSALQR